MATYTQTMTRVADRVLDGVRQVDEVVVNASSAVAERVGRVLPSQLPGATTLRSFPRPDELVKSYFDFIERFVKTQRTYSLDLVKAFEPITGKVWKPVRKASQAA